MLEASGQIVLLEPWFSNRTKSIIKSPKVYLSDTGPLCALLNIRSGEALRQSPAVGAVWEMFVFAQLRDRVRRGGRTGSLFFWRNRTREVDFVVDTGGRLELFEAKWMELPDVGDSVNLDFVPRRRQSTRSRCCCRLSRSKRLSASEWISGGTCDRTQMNLCRREDRRNRKGVTGKVDILRIAE
jgi:hypothetical protein